jgi:hypothetical protein
LCQWNAAKRDVTILFFLFPATLEQGSSYPQAAAA